MSKSHIVQVRIVNNTDSKFTFVKSHFEHGKIADGGEWPETIEPGGTLSVKCCESSNSLLGCSGWVEYARSDLSFPLYFSFSNPPLPFENKIGVGITKEVWEAMEAHELPVQKVFPKYNPQIAKYTTVNISSTGGETNNALWVINDVNTNTITAANDEVKDVPKLYETIRENGSEMHYKIKSWTEGSIYSHFKGVGAFNDKLIFTHTNIPPATERDGLYLIGNKVASGNSGAVIQAVYDTDHSPPWGHPGGVQVCGSYMAMAIQKSDDSKKSEIQIYDIRNTQINKPMSLVTAIIRESYCIESKNGEYDENCIKKENGGYDKKGGINGAGMTKESGEDGRYIVACSDGWILDIYRSDQSEISPDMTFKKLEVEALNNEHIHGGAGLGLITQTDGQLFFIGMHASTLKGPIVGDSTLNLYKITIDVEHNSASYEKVGQEKTMKTPTGSNIGFRWGKGLSITSPESVEIYATQRNINIIYGNGSFLVEAWKGRIQNIKYRLAKAEEKVEPHNVEQSYADNQLTVSWQALAGNYYNIKVVDETTGDPVGFAGHMVESDKNAKYSFNVNTDLQQSEEGSNLISSVATVAPDNADLNSPYAEASPPIYRLGQAVIETCIYNDSTNELTGTWDIPAPGEGAPAVTGYNYQILDINNEVVSGNCENDDSGNFSIATEGLLTSGSTYYLQIQGTAGTDVIPGQWSGSQRFEARLTGNILTYQDLQNMETNGHYVLAADIDCTGESDFSPIGNSSKAFSGSFNGNGYTISNLTINSTEDYVGLFGYTSGAHITDAVLLDVNITGADNVGGLVGYNANSATINNAIVRGNVTGSGSSVGGLVGYNNNKATITNSISTGSVSGGSDVGGLVGQHHSSCSVTKSCSASTVTGSGNNVGGLVGYSTHASVTHSYATGSVTGSGNYIGGLVGYNSVGGITNCYATGTVEGGTATGPVNYIGGLVGYNYCANINNCYAATGTVKGYGSSSYIGGLVGYFYVDVDNSYTIKNCYATGAVTGSGSSMRVGGLIGYSWINSGEISTIKNCYATGSVSGGSDVGGLVGSNSHSSITDCYAVGKVPGSTSSIGGLIGNNYPSASTITASYYDTTTTRQTTSAGGTGETDQAMKTKTTFASWKFGIGGDWVIKDGIDYPRLQWQAGTPEHPVEIATAQQLQDIGNDAESLLKYYVLAEDIDCSEIENFVPIGTSDQPFIGNFDGKGHTIGNLTINSSGNDYVGLFGAASGANITNVGLLNVNIVGADANYVGGLVGSNDSSTITDSCVTGSVSGTQYVGGLVGSNDNSSTIVNTYATASVTGSSGVGGLVGSNDNSSIIENAYATGEVTGSSDPSDTGGLVGTNSSSTTITSSYYDKKTTGQNDTGKGTPKTNKKMKEQSTFVDWDFDAVWSIIESIDYPKLRGLADGPDHTNIL